MDVLIFILMFAFLLYIYFVPSIIAVKRNHKNHMPIILLNIFLGWSLLGWVAALVWSTTAQDNQGNKKG